MTNNPPNNHHFIPAFYLKSWALLGKQLVEYSRPRDVVKARKKYPTATGFQPGLYSFNELPPETAQYFETEFFKPCDTTANIVLQRLLSGDLDIRDAEQRSSFARFLFTLQLRQPDAVAEFRAALPRLWASAEQTLESSYLKERTPDMPPTFAEYRAASGPLMPLRVQMYMMQAAFDNALAGQHLIDLKWSTLDVSKAPYSLLTSDWPIVMNNGEGTVLFPLHPRVLFIASRTLAITEGFVAANGPNNIVAAMNRYVVTHARRYVFASDYTQTQFIEDNFSAQKRPSPLFPQFDAMSRE